MRDNGPTPTRRAPVRTLLGTVDGVLEAEHESQDKRILVADRSGLDYQINIEEPA